MTLEIWRVSKKELTKFLGRWGEHVVRFFFSLFICLFLEANYFTILYWFCHTLTWIRHRCTCVPHPEPPSHLPHHPIPLGHPTTPEHPVSCIKPGLVIRFTYDNIHMSMPFSQINPPLPSPTESKDFYTSVSLLLVWWGRWEGGSGWGTRVHPWWIHVDVWQNQYNIVK